MRFAFASLILINFKTPANIVTLTKVLRYVFPIHIFLLLFCILHTDFLQFFFNSWHMCVYFEIQLNAMSTLHSGEFIKTCNHSIKIFFCFIILFVIILCTSLLCREDHQFISFLKNYYFRFHFQFHFCFHFCFYFCFHFHFHFELRKK